MSDGSPRDRFVTVFGFRPVLAALEDSELEVDKVLVAEGSNGPSVRDIARLARERDVPVQRVPPHRVKLLAGNGKHDNGVLADVVAPRMQTVTAALAAPYHERPTTVLVLDGVRTPANVGMILRSATAAGIGGIVVPHRGTAGIDPLVIKASAGVAFHAPVLRSGTALEAVEALVEAGYAVVGTQMSASRSLFEGEYAPFTAFVLGSETDGLSAEVGALVTDWVSIPMPGGGATGVESLNVSSAAAVVCFELVRRGLTAPRGSDRSTKER